MVWPGSGFWRATVVTVKKNEPNTKIEKIFNPKPGGGLRLHSVYKIGANGKILVWRRKPIKVATLQLCSIPRHH